MGYVLDKLANITHLQSSDVAIVDDHGTTTYGELTSRMWRLGNTFRKNECQRIALLADNGSDWIVTDLAALRTGVTVVPIPPFFSPAQIAHLLESASIDTVVASPALLSSFLRDDEFKELDCDAVDLQILKRRGPPPLFESYGQPCAKITFTSGSTGAPKGVMLSGTTIDLVVQRLTAAFEDIHTSRHLCSTPLATLLENIAGVYVPLMRGAMVVAPSVARLGLCGSSTIDADRFTRVLNQCRANSLILQPQTLRELTTAIQGQSGRRPEHLEYVAVGGAKVNDSDLLEANETGIPAFQGYGLSECASVVALNRPGMSQSGSVGKPLPGIDVRIADDGEIVVRGQSMNGYLGEHQPENHVIHTGDLGHLDEDGFLYVTGRKKDVFITSFGRNVSPEWPEAALLHEQEVSQACVFGEAMPYNTAVIVASDSAGSTSIASAIARANRQLPDYAQVTNWILADEPFSAESGLLTPTGKPRRDAIARRYLFNTNMPRTEGTRRRVWTPSITQNQGGHQ